MPNAQTSAPPAPAPVAPQAHPDPSAGFAMDGSTGMVSVQSAAGALAGRGADPYSQVDFSIDFANPMSSDNVLQDFDFDSFLHDGDNGDNTFDFNPTFDMQGTGEITTE